MNAVLTDGWKYMKKNWQLFNSNTPFTISCGGIGDGIGDVVVRVDLSGCDDTRRMKKKFSPAYLFRKLYNTGK